MKSNKDRAMKESKNTEMPSFVYRDGMTADKEYVEWLSDLKRRYKQSQLRTAVKANSEVLEYYWNLGRDIVAKEAESKWGSGFFNQLSLDMRAMFPDEKGFSSANLRYMKRWYEFYYQRIVNLQQTVEDLKMPDSFGFIPWGHHIYIFTKSQSLDEALFYINKVTGKNDNPSVGLLICKTAKKTIVEWSLQDIQKPLGVASYQLQEVVERTIAELENLKKDDVEEFQRNNVNLSNQNPIDVQNVTVNVAEELTERQQNIIRLIEDCVAQNVAVNTKYLSEKLNVNRKTIQRDMAHLQERKLIQWIGPDKTGQWKIIKEK